MKLGLALGGGGARGFAHIGVLKVLSAEGIEFDVVAGTSIGSLIGAVYAAGRLPQLEEAVRGFGLSDIPSLLSPTWSISGLFSGKNALDLLSDIVQVENIEELQKPYAAISVDLGSSQVLTHTSGNLRQAIRASIAIPGVFAPVAVGEQVLVDGGTLEPLPVEAAKRLGATQVLAVDLFGLPAVPTIGHDEGCGPLGSAMQYLAGLGEKLGVGDRLRVFARSRHSRLSIFEVLEQALSVSQRRLTELRLAEVPADFVIRPALEGVGTLDFHRGEEIIERGAAAARVALPELCQKFSLRQ